MKAPRVRLLEDDPPPKPKGKGKVILLLDDSQPKDETKVCFLHGSYEGKPSCQTCFVLAVEKDAPSIHRRREVPCLRCQAPTTVRLVMHEWIGVCPAGHPVAEKVKDKKP